MSTKELHPDIEELLFSEEEIEKRVTELATEINEKYKGAPLVVVGIL